jgi:hypothetical protein
LDDPDGPDRVQLVSVEAVEKPIVAMVTTPTRWTFGRSYR